MSWGCQSKFKVIHHAASRRNFLTAAGTATVASAAAAAFGVPATLRSALAAPLPKGSGTVVVYDGGGAWGAAQKAAYFEPFEAETGVRVVPNVGTPAARIQAGIKAGAPGYDVVDLVGGRLGTFLKEGLLQLIDYRWVEPEDQSSFFVPAHEYGVPSIFYSMALAYDAAKFSSAAPRRWADLWNVSQYPGPRTLHPGTNGPGGCTYEIALLADGVAPEKLYPLDWERAFKSLDRLRPSIAKFWVSGAEPVQLLVDRNVSVASAWNGRVIDAQAKGAKVGISFDQGVLQYNYWVVPKGAANVENAMKFIAFASRPGNQARFSELIAYGPSNARAFQHIKQDRAAMLPTAPDFKAKQVAQDYGWWSAEGALGRTNEQLAAEKWEKWITGIR